MHLHDMTPCKPCDNNMYRSSKSPNHANHEDLRVVLIVVIIVYKPLVIRNLINIMNNIKEAHLMGLKEEGFRDS